MGVASMSPTTGLTSTRLWGWGVGGAGAVVRNATTAVIMLADSEPVRLYAQM